MPEMNAFTTIHAEGALLPPDLLRRISDGDASLDGLTPESYHLSGQRINEAINQSWNTLQGAWANFKAAQEKLPPGDIGTSITRERWLLALFRELDFGRLPTAQAVEIDGRSYPISHRWEHVPIHLVSYQVDLDHRTRGVAGAAASSPHSLMQVFLNRSDDALWGFVSNGLKLRVLRDNASLTRQAYVEFDLQAMMDGESYSDFVLLWLVCHQSRVENERDCWLERWAKTAQVQGTRALDQLRDGVQAAIEALGVGFIAHPANTALRDRLQTGDLSAQDYYRQLLRLVYRLLFLFVAEDRGLLYDPESPESVRNIYQKHYSTRRLRQMAERMKGTRHTDLFESLRLVMALLGGENGYGEKAALIGLPVLGSFLWSEEAVAHIIACQLANTYLLDAVRALAFTEDRSIRILRAVDYKNLGPEELGSIYESLLELHPHINLDARTFALATAGGNERKTTGSYYTPSSLINALLDSALNPVIERAAYGENTAGGRALPDAEQRLLALKVCDPACGSGHFLIAAANRIALKLAEVRTGEESPAPRAVLEAKRDVIGHCIYGVDINEMAVELCKVNLWMEALEPGKPLNFLDHRILCGNSLLGTTPALMAGGIPDDAFNPIEGDDKADAAWLKKLNKQERVQREKGVRQLDLFAEAPAANYRALHDATLWIDRAPDETLSQVRVKERLYRELANDPERQKAQILADAWCAAFVWDKGASNALPPMTDLQYRHLQANPLDPRFDAVVRYVESLTKRYQFFHWHVAFSDVFNVLEDIKQTENEQTGWDGGFDCVLGNPPWEKVQPQEEEFFAAGRPDIAFARTAMLRKKLIANLSINDAPLHRQWLEYNRLIGGISIIIKHAGLLLLTSAGNLNYYRLFSELSSVLLHPRGRVGVIVQSSIATDESGKEFFVNQLSQGRLVSFYDFENRGNFFQAVHSQFRFALLTLAGSDQSLNLDKKADFGWMLENLSDISTPERTVHLSSEELFFFNPNSGTCPVFVSERDLSVSRALYSGGHYIYLSREQRYGQIDFQGELFNMTRDSSLFMTPQITLNVDYLPLYEAKCIHQYDHRFASQIGSEFAECTLTMKVDPYFLMMPRSYVESKEVHRRLSNQGIESFWLCGFRSVSNPTNERTAIFSFFPSSAVSNSINLILGLTTLQATTLVANANSFTFDYTCRQKIRGMNFNIWIAKQLPVIPPHTYTPGLLDFIVTRVLELTYTAWDLQPFAQDVGYDGPPFVWDDERRFLLRCELDALYFHLYQIARDDVDYIMETFPIVKRKDEASYGSYRTKDTILAMYDEMAALPRMSVPAPKPENGEMLVPDVSQWQTWLNPPPASPEVAHKVEE